MTDRGINQVINGALALLAALLIFVFSISSILKTRYASNHQSVTATIVSREEHEAKGRFTVVIADYWRGQTHCEKARFKLPGWSPEYNVGNVVSIFPREDSCDDPVTLFDLRTPPAIFVIAFLVLLSAGTGLIWSGFRDRLQTEVS